MRLDITALIVGLLACIGALTVVVLSVSAIGFTVLSTAGPFILIGVALVALVLATRQPRGPKG
ncbi:MAG: hypothetical protein LBQ92_03690 [Propionibacteriaceae bacterium]|jgi:hypothetical protein|nr:hypothetical protein [Propionibacteriaceae bacterium]